MTEPSSELERRLHEVLGVYFEAVEAGHSSGVHDLIARHPELADELAAFFASDERLRHLVTPLKSTVVAPGGETATLAYLPHPSATTSGSADPVNADAPPLPRGTRVRYLGDYELQKILGEGGMGV